MVLLWTNTVVLFLLPQEQRFAGAVSCAVFVRYVRVR